MNYNYFSWRWLWCIVYRFLKGISPFEKSEKTLPLPSNFTVIVSLFSSFKKKKRKPNLIFLVLSLERVLCVRNGMEWTNHWSVASGQWKCKWPLGRFRLINELSFFFSSLLKSWWRRRRRKRRPRASLLSHATASLLPESDVISIETLPTRWTALLFIYLWIYVELEKRYNNKCSTQTQV